MAKFPVFFSFFQVLRHFKTPSRGPPCRLEKVLAGGKNVAARMGGAAVIPLHRRHLAPHIAQAHGISYNPKLQNLPKYLIVVNCCVVRAPSPHLMDLPGSGAGGGAPEKIDEDKYLSCCNSHRPNGNWGDSVEWG